MAVAFGQTKPKKVPRYRPKPLVQEGETAIYKAAVEDGGKSILESLWDGAELAWDSSFENLGVNAAVNEYKRRFTEGSGEYVSVEEAKEKWNLELKEPTRLEEALFLNAINVQSQQLFEESLQDLSMQHGPVNFVAQLAGLFGTAMVLPANWLGLGIYKQLKSVPRYMRLRAAHQIAQAKKGTENAQKVAQARKAWKDLRIAAKQTPVGIVEAAGVVGAENVLYEHLREEQGITGNKALAFGIGAGAGLFLGVAGKAMTTAAADVPPAAPVKTAPLVKDVAADAAVAVKDQPTPDVKTAEKILAPEEPKAKPGEEPKQKPGPNLAKPVVVDPDEFRYMLEAADRMKQRELIETAWANEPAKTATLKHTPVADDVDNLKIPDEAAPVQRTVVAKNVEEFDQVIDDIHKQLELADSHAKANPTKVADTAPPVERRSAVEEIFDDADTLEDTVVMPEAERAAIDAEAADRAAARIAQQAEREARDRLVQDKIAKTKADVAEEVVSGTLDTAKIKDPQTADKTVAELVDEMKNVDTTMVPAHIAWGRVLFGKSWEDDLVEAVASLRKMGVMTPITDIYPWMRHRKAFFGRYYQGHNWLKKRHGVYSSNMLKNELLRLDQRLIDFHLNKSKATTKGAGASPIKDGKQAKPPTKEAVVKKQVEELQTVEEVMPKVEVMPKPRPKPAPEPLPTKLEEGAAAFEEIDGQFVVRTRTALEDHENPQLIDWYKRKGITTEDYAEMDAAAAKGIRLDIRRYKTRKGAMARFDKFKGQDAPKAIEPEPLVPEGTPLFEMTDPDGTIFRAATASPLLLPAPKPKPKIRRVSPPAFKVKKKAKDKPATRAGDVSPEDERIAEVAEVLKQAKKDKDVDAIIELEDELFELRLAKKNGPAPKIGEEKVVETPVKEVVKEAPPAPEPEVKPSLKLTPAEYVYDQGGPQVGLFNDIEYTAPNGKTYKVETIGKYRYRVKIETDIPAGKKATGKPRLSKRDKDKIAEIERVRDASPATETARYNRQIASIKGLKDEEIARFEEAASRGKQLKTKYFQSGTGMVRFFKRETGLDISKEAEARVVDRVEAASPKPRSVELEAPLDDVPNTKTPEPEVTAKPAASKNYTVHQPTGDTMETLVEWRHPNKLDEIQFWIFKTGDNFTVMQRTDSGTVKDSYKTLRGALKKLDRQVNTLEVREDGYVKGRERVNDYPVPKIEEFEPKIPPQRKTKEVKVVDKDAVRPTTDNADGAKLALEQRYPEIKFDTSKTASVTGPDGTTTPTVGKDDIFNLEYSSDDGNAIRLVKLDKEGIHKDISDFTSRQVAKSGKEMYTPSSKEFAGEYMVEFDFGEDYVKNFQFTHKNQVPRRFQRIEYKTLNLAVKRFRKEVVAQAKADLGKDIKVPTPDEIKMGPKRGAEKIQELTEELTKSIKQLGDCRGGKSMQSEVSGPNAAGTGVPGKGTPGTD